MALPTDCESLEKNDSVLQPAPRLGIVYTNPAIVTLCLDLIAQRHGHLLGKRIVDVGCGYGQFCAPMAARMAEEAIRRDESWNEFRDAFVERFRGVEIRQETAQLARERVSASVHAIFGHTFTRKELEIVIQCTDFLTWEADPPCFDIIVGNLPYVRYDFIPNLNHHTTIEDLRQNFDSFQGRADYSIPFLHRVLELRSAGGVAAVVTSNRFTRARYGRAIRALLASSPIEIHEIDLSNIRAFESVVSAYASLFFLSSDEGHDALYVRIDSDERSSLKALVNAIPRSQNSAVPFSITRRGKLPEDGAPWSTLPDTVTRALARLSSEFSELHTLGVTVRKGPATGADRVFVRPQDEFPFSRAARRRYLLPLFHWGSSQQRRDVPVDKYLLSVYQEGTGRLFELEELPTDVRAYLLEHKGTLESRHIVEVQRREWWRTIDAFDPALLGKCKILIPDLRPATQAVLDRGCLFPAHTAVYVTETDAELLEGLYHVLRSPIAEEFRFWQSPDMGRNSPRASSGVLRKLPIPGREVLLQLRCDDAEFNAVYDAFRLTKAEKKIFEERRQERLSKKR